MVDQKGEFPEVFYGGIRPVASPLSRPISSLLQRQKHGQSGVLQPSRREGPGGHRWLARSGGARLVEEPSVALLGLRERLSTATQRRIKAVDSGALESPLSRCKKPRERED
eukprot:scaffold38244_cov30-Tisochrysis_lutea.AAC.1